MTLSEISDAAGNGEVDVVRSLLRERPPQNFIEVAFYAAARSGRLEVMRILRDKGISVQGISNALGEAAAESQVEAVQELLRMGTLEHVRSDALELAVAKGHVDVVRALMPYCDPWASTCRALEYAARLEDTAVMNAFVEEFGERAIEYWERGIAAAYGVSEAARNFCAAWRARQAAAKMLAAGLGHRAGPTAG